MATSPALVTSAAGATQATTTATISSAQAVLTALAAVITAAQADLANPASTSSELVAAQAALSGALAAQQQYNALLTPQSTHTYTVAQGDTLEKIAQLQLGDMLQFTAIQASNGMKGRFIVPGQVLILPPLS